MMKKCSKSMAFVLAYTACIAAACAADVRQVQTTRTLADDGAWCWFQDPRAVYVAGKHKRTYAQWMTHDGKLKIGSYDHDTGTTADYTLKEAWGADDHNVGSFLVLPDNRLMVFYATHGKKGLYCRAARQPESISEWNDEVTVVDGPGVTYSHPVYLSKEKKFYVFWRGAGSKPTFATSVDGVKWSPPKTVIEQKGRTEYRGIRPYTKIVSDGKSAIHFAFTDGHPQKEPHNSVYYLRYENGAFFKADGTKAGDMDSLPIQHSESDLVYDAGATNKRAWVWDIGLDEKGLPVILYSRMSANGTEHWYHYARWTGTKWLDAEICKAGTWFPETPRGVKETEPYYSGGMCLDHSDPSIVFASRQVGGTFEIEKWTTSDGGLTWLSTAVTQKSDCLNVRPVVPRGYAGKADHVLWMRGRYRHFTRFNTGIMMTAPQ